MRKSQTVARELQRRRMRGGRLLLEGVAQAEVARRLGVTRTTVSNWNRHLQEYGLEGLKAGVRGRPPRLHEPQRAELLKTLLRGALAEGFPTELWTLSRVGVLIRRRFGHRYSQSQVCRILTGLGFSSRRPGSRAPECSGSARARWKRQRGPAPEEALPARPGASSSSASRDRASGLRR